MWWMLNTLPTSTRHSAVDWPFAEIVHWFPNAVRTVYLPSTALSAPQGNVPYGCCCHADFVRAKFSGKKKNSNKVIDFYVNREIVSRKINMGPFVAPIVYLLWVWTGVWIWTGVHTWGSNDQKAIRRSKNIEYTLLLNWRTMFSVHFSSYILIFYNIPIHAAKWNFRFV